MDTAQQWEREWVSLFQCTVTDVLLNLHFTANKLYQRYNVFYTK